MRLDDPFRHYLQAVQQATGAIAATLYLHSAQAGAERGLLLHLGEAAAVPQFTSLERAYAFVEQLARPVGGMDAARLQIVAGATAEQRFLRLPLALVTPKSATAGASGMTATGRRKSDQASSAELDDQTLWLGLRYPVGKAPAVDPEQVLGRRPVLQSIGSWAEWALLTAGTTAWKSYRLGRQLHDPASGLPGRVELLWYLRDALDAATRSGQSTALLLVNPNEFALVNHRVGRTQGDEVLREIGQRMRAALRATDVAFRYGGAVLAAVMPGTAHSDLLGVGEKLRRNLNQGAYLDGAVRLTFSIGGVAAGAADLADGSIDGNLLLHRADQALNTARLSGGGRTLVWQPDGLSEAAGNLNLLSGVFTADTEKDYRNMLLLWETVTVISAYADPKALASAFVKRLREALALGRTSLYAQGAESEAVLLASADGRKPEQVLTHTSKPLGLTAPQRALVERARSRKATERSVSARTIPGGDETTAETYVLPLFARARYLGFMLLQNVSPSASLDSSDLLFLEALARQLAVALDRAQLAEERQLQLDMERQQLRAEVRDLRDALQPGSFIYESTSMHDLVRLLEQVAPTEATVLVTGESGTGKEVVARTLHQLSQRQQAPFVTVDCGAVAHGLLETELFGHVKGAFTGANATSTGRIALADGGTLFLDEIGELPLELQAKLLRVVQEREITPVGGTSARSIDVRIIAATNRDLETEVAQGRFRSDLYYRLQVVTLRVPALRERRDDVLPLAQFFLEKFALQHRKPELRFSNAAQQALLDGDWPGNVRELQNRVFQAVVLSTGPRIDAAGVAPLNGNTAVAPATTPEPTRTPTPVQPVSPDAGANIEPPTLPGKGAPAQDHWEALREALRERVASTLNHADREGVVPLGRWLIEDLVLAADEMSDGVATAASAQLGMADTTFRRQREKLRTEVSAGLHARTPDWRAVRPLLAGVVAADAQLGATNVTKRARSLLLEEVMDRVNGNATVGAKLMGVTLPTYRRWVTERHDGA